MKKCPFCAEEIQDEAVKCRFCGEFLEKPKPTAEIQSAIDYGIDVSMLIQNVKRSCTERIIRHQIALNTVEKLRKARRL